MDGMKSFSACLISVSLVLLHCAAAKETEIQALVNSDVLLPCRVDVKQCGTLHSVKWYKDTSRLYVFSQAGQIRRGEENATERMNVTYNEARNETLLQIFSVKVEDEATYKCEITYLEVGENCDVVQIVKLTTLVKPTDVILTYNNKEVKESSELEEKSQGDVVVLTCTAPGGKPVPTVNWYNGTQPMNRATYTSHGDASPGLGTGKSELQFTLSRGDLNARFECRVESQALEEPITRGIQLPVKVSPTNIELSGVTGFVSQGTSVTLLCRVFGARPKAEVEWYNETQIVTNKSREIEIVTTSELHTDGTYTTLSRLMFTATRFEDRRKFECLGKNEVSVNQGEIDFQALIFLDVRYPPVITVTALGNTVVRENASIILSCEYFANPQKVDYATWLKDGKNITRIAGKHKNGDTKTPSLTITNISRDDMGEYSCLVQNAVNASVSEDVIFLDVHYPPDVEVIMVPSKPANATELTNVTLECNVTSGNPPALRKVSWFLNRELMAALPECNYQSPINDTLGGPFCGIDPSILSLIFVDKEFAGNYTCQGENDAGVGPASEPRELVVYYPPSNVTLTHFPKKVIKQGEVTLTCNVKEKGFPADVTYLWFRGSHLVHNITTPNWTINHASLETRSKFSCIPMNKGGQGEPAFDYVDVEAPPSLITKDNKPYKGVLYSSKNMSLTCRIECFPLCSIKWFKNGHEINFERNNLYYVINKTHEADYKKNDFESIESTLVWNITNWPGQQLDKSANDSFYTCASYDPPERHRVGVNYTTSVGVEYPPEKVTVFPEVINVTEDAEVETSVKCTGNGRPNLSYVWKRNLTSDPIIKADTLKQTAMSRSAAGYYYCEAYNKHGNQTARVRFNVWYKPTCEIERGKEDDKSILICRAEGNPSEMSYTWKVIEQNETRDLHTFGLKLFLNSTDDKDREYLCVANNTIKASDPCSIKLLGNKMLYGALPWYFENLIVLIASIIALVICVIIVCVVIIVLCRKKRQNTKSPNPSSTRDKMRLGAAPPVGGSADPANDHDKGFYENLPFHGMQNPPNKPYRPEFGDLEYADVDYNYGPINYKAASIYAAMKRNKNNNRMEEVDKPNDDLL